MPLSEEVQEILSRENVLKARAGFAEQFRMSEELRQMGFAPKPEFTAAIEHMPNASSSPVQWSNLSYEMGL